MQNARILPYDVFKRLAQDHSRIGVYYVLNDHILSSISLFKALEKNNRNPCLLESNPKEKINSRYTTISFDPFLEIQSIDKQTTIIERGDKFIKAGDPFEILRDYQKRVFTKHTHALPGFIGGLVGFMSYDAIRLSETISDQHDNTHQVPDLLFRSYQTNIVFDHQTHKIIITQLADCEQVSVDEAYQRACNRLDQIVDLIETSEDIHREFKRRPLDSTVQLDVDDHTHRKMVEKAKEHIKKGDIFQVVLSREFSVDIKDSPFVIYQALTQLNPSPYMFYMQFNDCAIAGSSPEMLVNVKDNVIMSRPLAGTRPRDPARDEEVAYDLLHDEKEIAEHMMLVDLARNDVGKVSNIGSVKVTKLKDIEKYTRVMHISSTVEGILSSDYDLFDVLKQAMPAGTLSGAPKIKAMDIIDSLEHSRRGIYGGTICAIDAKGNLESCIAIRTVFIRNNKAYVRAGGGIVLDSDPQTEATETRHKARAMLEAILASQANEECH